MATLSMDDLQTISLLIRDAIQEHRMIEKNVMKQHFELHEQMNAQLNSIIRAVEKALPKSVIETEEQATTRNQLTLHDKFNHE